METFIQYIFYLAVLILLAIPLGKYISKAMSGEKVFGKRCSIFGDRMFCVICFTDGTKILAIESTAY